MITEVYILSIKMSVCSKSQSNGYDTVKVLYMKFRWISFYLWKNCVSLVKSPSTVIWYDYNIDNSWGIEKKIQRKINSLFELCIKEMEVRELVTPLGRSADACCLDKAGPRSLRTTSIEQLFGRYLGSLLERNWSEITKV